jgi:hypothetical protein
MSAESREKAKENGQKSGKGLELVSRAVEKLAGWNGGTDDS